MQIGRCTTGDSLFSIGCLMYKLGKEPQIPPQSMEELLVTVGARLRTQSPVAKAPATQDIQCQPHALQSIVHESRTRATAHAVIRVE